MSIGIRTSYAVAANIPVASSVALITTGLTSPIAANQEQKVRVWLPFSVGATGGIRLQVTVPAGGVLYELTGSLNNTVAPSSTLFEQQASAVITNAVANAGDHWISLDLYVLNGATAGNIDVQIAQNTSDALTLTIKRGGNMDVIQY